MTQGGQGQLGPGPEERGERAKNQGGHPVMEGKQKKERRDFFSFPFFFKEESRDVWLESEIMTEGNHAQTLRRCHTKGQSRCTANARFKQSQQKIHIKHLTANVKPSQIYYTEPLQAVSPMLYISCTDAAHFPEYYMMWEFNASQRFPPTAPYEDD